MRKLCEYYHCDKIHWLPKDRVLKVYNGNKMEFSIRNVNTKAERGVMNNKLLELIITLDSYEQEVIIMKNEKLLNEKAKSELRKLSSSDFNGIVEGNTFLTNLVKGLKGHHNNPFVFVSCNDGMLSLFYSTQRYKSPRLLLTYESESNKCTLA